MQNVFCGPQSLSVSKQEACFFFLSLLQTLAWFTRFSVLLYNFFLVEEEEKEEEEEEEEEEETEEDEYWNPQDKDNCHLTTKQGTHTMHYIANLPDPRITR